MYMYAKQVKMGFVVVAGNAPAAHARFQER